MESIGSANGAAALRVRRVDGWGVATLVIAALVSLPVLSVAAYVFVPAGEVWQHLADTVLRDYVSNSIVLMLGVGVGTLAIGVPAPWLCSMCVFPGRRVFEWALLLSLAFPAYIIAYTYTGMLDFTGPVQTQLREWFGWGYGDYWFPDVRSLGGAIAMMSLVLYPYVYLLTRAAFLEQSVCVLDVSRTLGASPLAAFLRIALPMARPGIITGVSLAQMETLADYGTVQYFGVSTFTTGIFRTWFGLGDGAAAAQLSALLLGFVFVLILFERWSRRKARFHHTSRRYQNLPQYHLTGTWRWLAVFACLIPLGFGFLLPAGQLVGWTLHTWRDTVDADFFGLIINTLSLAGAAAIITLLLALVLAYGKRLRNNALTRTAVGIASMGYAVPGTVLAVGVLLPFAWLDKALDAWMRSQFGVSTGLVLSGTLVALLFA
jgi:iron(III) transport system permease protein